MMRSSSLAVFACLSKVCAPPPAGKGGSLPSTGGSAPTYTISDGQVRVGGVSDQDTTELVFGTSSGFDLERQTIDSKIKANRAIASHLATDKEFQTWVDKNGPRAAANLNGMARALKSFAAEVPAFRSALTSIVEKRDSSVTWMSAALIATVDEVGEAMRKAYGIPSLTNSDVMARIIVRPMIDAWAGSSTTNESVFAQIAAASVHKVSMSGYKKAFPADLADAKESLKDGYTFDPWVHEAVIRAEYAATQQWFADKGIKSITVFRGMRDIRGDLEAGDVVKVGGNPLSSWTTTRTMAQQFAVLDGTSSPSRVSGNLVIAMEVPVSSIQSIPLTGRGCLIETEVVLIGKPATALVTDTSATLERLIQGKKSDTMNGMADSGLSS